ncbi:MAG TPA: PPK2 family polyphosphate kinase, partial [Burkholderiaceae bacterium]|nr:PPK2 family polyphosphate kinase [Burkholderiaceae bacterium]
MMDRQMLKQLATWVDPFRVTDGSRFRLRRIDPADTGGLKSESKRQAAQRLANGVRWLAAEQDKLYAQDRRSLLLVFQAMDAAGKDSTIKHVMSGVNPQGCQVVAFKQPSAEDLDHDWLWRCWKHLPERGRIGIFNRSYYEEVLVVRVHRAILDAQKLPTGAVTKKIFRERLRDIACFENYLHRNGTTVLKFFLHVSKDEQKKRFLERLDEPEKNWKFAAGDVRERARWDDYMAAYEDAIRATATR